MMHETAQRPSLVSRQLSNEERSYYSSLIEALVRRRKALGWSQAQLDYKLGVSDGLVAKWETAARLPGAFFLMCWCAALGVKLTVIHEEKAN